MFKKTNVIYFILISVALFLILSSCDGRKGTLNTNSQPHIMITDYFGVDSLNQIGNPQLFQQIIQWSGYDEDGIVEGFAFRVLNEDEEPIITPGHDVIDENGWVKFYAPNADTDIPLDQSTETTIWIDQSYATINFPAADANGDSANIISIFEVKCIDNSEEESDIARKYFQAYSTVPTLFVASTKGPIDGETISTAIIFEFTMLDDDPYVGSIPYYFLYKLEKRDLENNIIPDGYPDEWISTYGLPDISQALHSGLYDNPLIPNTLTGDVPQDSTFLRAKAVDAALIESEEEEISFIVKEGFYPGTVIYYGEGDGNKNGIYALGTHHFASFLDEGLNDILPSVMTSDGAHHATSFWCNGEGKYTAIGSDDFKIYMRWGYNGEFENNNPQKQRLDETLDELTNQPYYCEIVYYDIRLDGAPYYYPPIPAIGVFLQVDDDGKEWLRIPVYSAIGQKTTVTLTSFGGVLDNMYGEHTFEVRAVDLQGEVDQTPHEFTFTIVPPILKAEKVGVLIIDDESSTSEAPGAIVDSLYTYFVSDYTPEPGYINREDRLDLLITSGIAGLHHGKSIIASSDIQQYKVIIYHSDNGIAESKFWKEYESLKIFLLQEGNLIVSAGATLKTVHVQCGNQAFSIMEDYFGIPMNNDEAIDNVSVSYYDQPFFIGATSQGSYPDLDLQLPSFNPIITNIYVPLFSVNGLGPVAYFVDYDAEVIYRYKCKDVGEDPPGLPPNWHIVPTQEEYDMYNDLPVALKKVNSNNTCYIFGFPLCYMVPDQVKSMMTQILNDLP
ncbi:MAG: hypothetical protein ISS80_03115 [Candidatus Cloacimonetes bacterium]|nr:hypothetical protein [Candidatus Cloacimonadota bacterium]MBL7149041.1 hypothetical protein [Candidatus Cloacimonadota bacterium]